MLSFLRSIVINQLQVDFQITVLFAKLKRTDLHETWITKAIVPLEFHLAKLIFFIFCEILFLWIYGFNYKNKWTNFFWIHNNSIRLLLVTNSSFRLVLSHWIHKSIIFGVFENETDRVREYRVFRGVRDFDLQKEPIIVNLNMLWNRKRKHSFKFIFFCLLLRDCLCLEINNSR